MQIVKKEAKPHSSTSISVPFLNSNTILPSPNKAVGKSPEDVMRYDSKTNRERQYEAEIEILKARIAYFESLEYMQPFLKKHKAREIRYLVILKLETRFPIGILCNIACINRSAFYKFKHKKHCTLTDITEP
ncbi:MAG: hypothetical protein Q8882_05070 [Bacillota bacterium]|nr:hypothetical protein [Bacillota bacterium]